MSLASSSGSLPSDSEDEGATPTDSTSWEAEHPMDAAVDDMQYWLKSIVANIKGAVKDIEMRADCYDEANNRTVALKLRVKSCQYTDATERQGLGGEHADGYDHVVAATHASRFTLEDFEVRFARVSAVCGLRGAACKR
jgi:hypothetical protein